MKRDMDLIRRIALEVEALDVGDTLDGLDGVEEEVFSMHAIWMDEAGLVDASINEYLDGLTRANIKRLTWDGCEFVDAIRSDTLWVKAKENVMKPSMSFTFGILKDWLKSEITQGLPTIRALGQ